MVLAAWPWVHAIRAATGEMHLLPTSGGINFYLGNSADPCQTINIRPGYEWDRLVVWPRLHGAYTPAQQDAFFRRQAWRDIREHPGVFVRNLADKTRQFFSSREIPRNLDYYLLREESRVLRGLSGRWGRFGFPFGCVLGLAVLGAVTRRTTWGVALAILGYAAAMIAVHVCDRYRIPVIPLFLALAALGLVEWADAWRARRFRRALFAGGVVMLFGMGSSAGARFCAERLDYRAEYHRLTAMAAAEQRDLALAEAQARQALASNPREAQAWGLLGHLAIHHGDMEAAREFIQTAVDCDPDYFLGWINLGELAAKRGDSDEAVRLFRLGLDRGPAWLTAWIKLGDILMAANRREEARACFQRALDLSPGYSPARQRLADLEASARP
jgi:Tfp pilus assembly protein PilF